MKIPITIKTNMVGFNSAIREAVYGNSDLSFHSCISKGMADVLDKVISQYDISARSKSGELRRNLNNISVMRDGDSIVAGIGDTENLPFYWKFLEYGTKTFTFDQPFRVQFVEGGYKLRPIKKALTVGQQSFSASFNIVPGIGLIKNIRVTNPGIRQRGFFMAGKNYLDSNGQRIFGTLFVEMFNKMVDKHSSRKP